MTLFLRYFCSGFLTFPLEESCNSAGSSEKGRAETRYARGVNSALLLAFSAGSAGDDIPRPEGRWRSGILFSIAEDRRKCRIAQKPQRPSGVKNPEGLGAKPPNKIRQWSPLLHPSVRFPSGFLSELPSEVLPGVPPGIRPERCVRRGK